MGHPLAGAEIAPDGTVQKRLRYEALGDVTRNQAAQTLADRLAASDHGNAPTRSRVAFRTLVSEWQAHVVTMYKHSTQKNHRHIVKKHLVPRFGDMAIADITRQEVQAYMARLVSDGYAPRSVDHIHDVLSAVLRTAVRWGHLRDNPARDVNLPALVNVRPKWVLTIAQAAALPDALPPLARTMVGVALVSGLRRGELFALRWRDVDEQHQCLTVSEAVCEGTFSTPKTAAGHRQIPLSAAAMQLILDWRARVTRREPDSLLFATWSGKPISPNNVARRWVFPACDALQLRRVNWLTLRRYLILAGAREGSAGQSHRAADGTREGRHDAQRVHASDGRCAPQGRGARGIRIVHDCSQIGRDERAGPLKSLGKSGSPHWTIFDTGSSARRNAAARSAVRILTRP